MKASRRVLLTAGAATVAAASTGVVLSRRAAAEPVAAEDDYPSNTALYADPALREGVDYRLRYRLNSDHVTRPGPVAIVGPHGGGIEPGTSELVLGFAGLDPESLEPVAAPGYDWWMFEGIRDKDNGELHVTSTHCDDKIALALCDRSTHAVGLHGCSEAAAGLAEGTRAILVGGRSATLHAAMLRELTAAGFDARDWRDKPSLGGMSTENICNRTRSGGGVQLEITRPLRAACFDSDTPATRPGSINDTFRALVKAGRTALATV